MIHRIALPFLAVMALSAASLPDTGPVPAPKPAPAEQAKPEPAAKEADSLKEADSPAPAPEKTDSAPTVEQALAIEPENPDALKTCLAALKAIGATFTEDKRIDDGKGCGIDRPITLTAVLPGIALEPKGTMRCETALKLAEWVRDSVIPSSATALGGAAKLTTVHQASSYVCRTRNGVTNAKLSEHARGNAIDIASLTFDTGDTIAIEPRDEDSTLTGAFQRTITASGCLYFSTVLDPGSDAAHEDHLHLDVLSRTGGYRYCR